MITHSTGIDYDHSKNRHTIEGPRAAFGKLWPHNPPSSILDVGCGTGTWLRAALDYGVMDVCGIDGVEVPAESLLIPAVHVHVMDLTKPIDLKRRFAAALCLEVAEHLDPTASDVLLDTLVTHSDYIVFSAAIPDQAGQHHVNCQWPAWWQERFNERGYCCDDGLRWRMWEDTELEPWYRQNMFIAYKDPKHASLEPRIRPVVHPEMLSSLSIGTTRESVLTDIIDGGMPVSWYFKTLGKAVCAKASRRAKILSACIQRNTRTHV